MPRITVHALLEKVRRNPEKVYRLPHGKPSGQIGTESAWLYKGEWYISTKKAQVAFIESQRYLEAEQALKAVKRSNRKVASVMRKNRSIIK